MNLPAAGLENELSAALGRGEISLHYQPKYDILRGRVSSVEALMRWTSPRHGKISPGVFIPMAERLGLINDLGRWALGEACRTAAKYYNPSRPTSVAVNASPNQLARGAEFAEEVAREIESAGLPFSAIEIEVTENAILNEDAQEAVLSLSTRGIHVSLDDFGTGYSSLAYLRRLRPGTLKIDRAFVEDVPESLESCVLLKAVINIGHSLGMRVVAEGVETHDQVLFLEHAGCDVLQGFFLARPMPEAELVECLRSGRIERLMSGEA
ncbi:MAG: hypothetical protein DRJ42_12010 [Deltaproteobacteria bacterium]|nr:MAG: hypothetical protein DRJ42_12010 [Deltaproteobacteria bacterium]